MGEDFLNKKIDINRPGHLLAVALVLSVVVSSAMGFFIGFSGGELVKEFSVQGPISQIAQQGIYQGEGDYETRVIQAVRQDSPSVVSVIQTKDVPIIENCTTDPFGSFRADPFFRQFFGDLPLFEQQCQRGTQKKEVGGGSGFIISQDGLIVTNKHVVADSASEYTVLTNDGKKFPAEVLARDPLQDLAVLKIEAEGLPVVRLGDSDQLQIGQTVIAIGNALGEFRNTVSVGTISGLARSIVASGAGSFTERLDQVIQTDAAINPGNSGGPLLNLRGEVIGINTAIAQGAENIGFALPINRVKRAIESVREDGKIVYPFLGVRYVMLDAETAQEEGLSVTEGALVQKGGSGEAAIVKDSPAERAGIREGDVIVAFDGEAVTNNKPLAQLIQQRRPGETVTLSILRGNETVEKTVVLAEYDQ